MDITETLNTRFFPSLVVNELSKKLIISHLKHQFYFSFFLKHEYMFFNDIFFFIFFKTNTRFNAMLYFFSALKKITYISNKRKQNLIFIIFYSYTLFDFPDFFMIVFILNVHAKSNLCISIKFFGGNLRIRTSF